MADDGIYRKTEKGRTEIATRANKLGMRERTMLIMVDDKTPRSGLLSRSAHPSTGDILDALLAQEFIEVDTGAVSAVKAAAPAAEAAPVSSASSAAADVEVSLTSASRFACRALMDIMGPAADDLTALVEKSRTREDLAIVLEKCRVILQGMVGKQKAETFWAGVSARLPKA
jgi:uncharacterized heparinase superfamily protein